MCIKCHQKPKIATLLTFLTKQRKILQRSYPRQDFFLHKHCLQVCTFLHLCIPPWSAVQLMWGLCNFSYCGEIFLADYTFFLRSDFSTTKKGQSRQKFLSSWKLKLHSPHIRYRADQGGISNIMGIAIFFIKGSS